MSHSAPTCAKAIRPTVDLLRALTILLLAIACGQGTSSRSTEDRTPPASSSNEPRPLEITQIPEAAEEVHETAEALIDERELRAAFVGDGLEVRVPLHRKGNGELRGRIQVVLLDAKAAEPVEVARHRIAFEQDEDDLTHRVLLRDLPTSWVRAQTATLVLDWAVEPEGEDVDHLSGKRSLYEALGPLEVLLRGPSELREGAASPMRVIVRHRQTAEAVEDAVVVATFSVPGSDDEPSELFIGSTNEFGELNEQIELPTGVQQGQVRVDVTHDVGQVWNTSNVRLKLNEKRAHLSTDKTIYKPGQDIELRLLALDGADRDPMVREPVVFEAFDGKGLKVFKRSATTDEYGVASARVPTDTRVNEGNWRIQALVAGQTQTLQLPVRRYILPKMQVDVVPDRPFVLAGEALSGRVEARYLFGEPVANASVVLTASGAGLPTAQLQGTTDEDGSYAFELSTPQAVAQNVAFALRIEVLDAAGQRESGSGQVVVAREPVVVELLPELQPVTRGVRNRLLVLVSDPLGRPLVSDVEIEGLSDEPLALQTSPSGIAAVEFTPAEQLNVTLRATDGAQRSGTARLMTTPVERPSFLILSDRPVYAAGEEAVLSLYATPDVERAYVDLLRGVEGVTSDVVELDRGVGELRIPITAGMGGLLLAEAQALSAEGPPKLAAARLLVDADQRLRVNIVPSADSFRPGDEASLEVRVTDSEGNPRVASLGLTVVNQASFALGGDPPRALEQTFTLDDSLLNPNVSVLGRTGLDLMNLPPSEERDLLARSLFAKSSSMPGSAAPSSSSRFDYDSGSVEPPQVQAAVRAKVQADGTALIATLRADFTGTEFETELWFETVETMAKRLQDPFGQPYVVEVNSTNQTLQLTCHGPDEIEGTADDVTVVLGIAAPRPPSPVNPSNAGGFDPGFPNGLPAAPPPQAAPAPGDFLNDAAQAPTSAEGPAAAPQGPTGVAVRSDFRETVYANPTLITDAEGLARVTFPLAHSISSWRASADGSSAHGHLGSARTLFRTFQSFFVDFDMPTHLTQGDELELPVIVYNYLAEPADVEVTLQADGWLELANGETQRVSLGPSEVRAVKFFVRIVRAGEHSVALFGSAGDVSDAMLRHVSVEPDGEPQDQTASGTLEPDNGALHTMSVPAGAIDGGTSLTLTLTPGFAADAAKGMDGMLREPNGCFEQTLSSAWPNTLVAQVLSQTGELVGEKHEKTVALVTRGYQRLLTFESPTGGYNWWGNSDPGNRILSAILLWHLKDLESLIETDPAVRERTLQWLLRQQNSDGSWDSGDALHAGNQSLSTSPVRATAFITWALAHTGWADEAVARGTRWLADNPVEDTDAYGVALAANALVFGAPGDSTTAQRLNQLDALQQATDDGQIVWRSTAASWTGSPGDRATTELTSLAAYGLLRGGNHLASAQGALRHIVASKDSVGTWYNTQATMNALRALSAAIAPGDQQAASGSLTVRINGAEARVVGGDPAQKDVFQTFDLSAFVNAAENTVELSYAGTGKLNYQVTRRAYVPWLDATVGSLSLGLSYDRQEVRLGQRVRATAIATNHETAGSRDQVMVRVGRAPGFVPDTTELEALIAAGVASRYEVRENDVTFYLMGLAAGESRPLAFSLTSSLALDASAPSSSIYPYYEPSRVHSLGPERFRVTAE